MLTPFPLGIFFKHKQEKYNSDIAEHLFNVFTSPSTNNHSRVFLHVLKFRLLLKLREAHLYKPEANFKGHKNFAALWISIICIFFYYFFGPY